jgi:replication factor C subunit 1
LSDESFVSLLDRYKKRPHPILFELSDTTPLKSKAGKASAEEPEGVIFDVEPDAGDELDDDDV